MKKRSKIYATNKASLRDEHSDILFSDIIIDSNSIADIEDIWNNLPTDVDSTERFLFLEIAEKVIKTHRELSFLRDSDLEKN